MSKAQGEWQKIFKYVVALAKDSCKNNKSLTYPQAVKKAWKDPKVLAKRKEYERKKEASKRVVRKVYIPLAKSVPNKVTKKVAKKAVKKVTKKVTKKVVKK